MLKILTAEYLATLAQKHFGIKLPTDPATLKTAYRAAARKLHSDLTHDTATEEQFKLMAAAYAVLIVPNAPGVFAQAPEELATVDGVPLSELGLGLGRHKNGRDCKECKGKGYDKRRRKDVTWWPYNPCHICVLAGSTWGCQQCSRLIFRHTDKIVEEYHICAPCQGTGEIELLNPVIPKGFLAVGNLGQKARKRLAQNPGKPEKE